MKKKNQIKRNVTYHAIKRTEQRTDLKGADRKELLDGAIRKGTPIVKMPDCPLKEHLKKIEDDKTYVKVYKGYIFIFNKTTIHKKLLTMYVIPYKVMQLQKEFEKTSEMKYFGYE